MEYLIYERPEEHISRLVEACSQLSGHHVEIIPVVDRDLALVWREEWPSRSFYGRVSMWEGKRITFEPLKLAWQDRPPHVELPRHLSD